MGPALHGRPAPEAKLPTLYTSTHRVTHAPTLVLYMRVTADFTNSAAAEHSPVLNGYQPTAESGGFSHSPAVPACPAVSHESSHLLSTALIASCVVHVCTTCRLLGCHKPLGGWVCPAPGVQDSALCPVSPRGWCGMRSGLLTSLAGHSGDVGGGGDGGRDAAAPAGRLCAVAVPPPRVLQPVLVRCPCRWLTRRLICS